MPRDTPSVIRSARWKLANVLWPERLRPNKLVTRWRLRACEAEAIARWQAAGGHATGRPRPEARSQTGEDALLWDLLGDRENGFFIEAGAYDGYTFSVSYLFECAGWNGILVEPLADRAAECAERRSASRVIHAALSRPGFSGTAMVARRSVEWESQLVAADEPACEPVPVVTFDEILQGHSGPIDFVVLDVEGHELPALEGFDLERWTPSVLLIEDNGTDEVQPHIEGRGYVYVTSLAQNDVYVLRDEVRLRERLGRFWDDLGPPAGG